MRTPALLALAVIPLLAACESKPKATAESTGSGRSPLAPTLALYDLASENPETHRLPKEIFEISGLATNSEGRLFAHGDEKGLVVELDPSSGAITKRFTLGDPPERADFEGIAISGSRLFMITSDGRLYAFSEGSEGEAVEPEIVATGLERFDIEGLCVDADGATLLVACKEMPDERWRGRRAVFAWSIERRALEPEPRLLIDEAEVESLGGGRTFRPSGIERHPTTGSYLVVASQGSAIAELSADGRLLGVARLSKSVHDQPEGIAVASDGSLLISNEGSSRGTLVRYPMRQHP